MAQEGAEIETQLAENRRRFGPYLGPDISGSNEDLVGYWNFICTPTYQLQALVASGICSPLKPLDTRPDSRHLAAIGRAPSTTRPNLNWSSWNKGGEFSTAIPKASWGSKSTPPSAMASRRRFWNQPFHAVLPDGSAQPPVLSFPFDCRGKAQSRGGKYFSHPGPGPDPALCRRLSAPSHGIGLSLPACRCMF